MRGLAKQRLIFILAFFLLSFPSHAASFSDRLHLLSPPQPIPPLVFEDADKVQHALSDYRGRFVVLNIWATWCQPCVREMPSLDKLQQSFDPRRLIVVPLSEDRGEGTVGAFYRSHGLTHLPTALDTAGRAPSALHFHGFPTTFLIDPQGQALARIDGETDWVSPESLSFLQNMAGRN